MSKRDAAICYLLRHRIAFVLAGFVVLADQLGTDWALRLSAGGVYEWGRFGPLWLGYLEAGVGGALALPLVFAVLGGLGLYRRVTLLRRGVLAPLTRGPASELVLLAGAAAAFLNLMFRGAVVTPVAIAPLGWGLSLASLVALPAALILLAEGALGRVSARTARATRGAIDEEVF